MKREIYDDAFVVETELEENGSHGILNVKLYPYLKKYELVPNVTPIEAIWEYYVGLDPNFKGEYNEEDAHNRFTHRMMSKLNDGSYLIGGTLINIKHTYDGKFKEDAYVYSITSNTEKNSITRTELTDCFVTVQEGDESIIVRSVQQTASTYADVKLVDIEEFIS